MYAVTSSVTARAFLVGQLSAVSERARVSLLVGDDLPTELLAAEGVDGFTLGLPRRPSPFQDLRGLVRLVILLRRERPSVLIFGTPKMGLLAAIAAALVRTPRRIYVIHGVRWEAMTGAPRMLLRALEMLSCRLATDVVAVSDSVRSIAEQQLRVPNNKVRVIHHGSANGIDSERFVPLLGAARDSERRRHGIAAEAVLYVFAGRLTRDKGIEQLVRIWPRIEEQVGDAHLVVVGQPEPVDSVDEQAISQLGRMSSVSLLSPTPEIELLFGAADLNLSLSRREGMPTVILEAASCGVPTVGFAVTGVVDAVSSTTGVLVPLDAQPRFVAEAVSLGLNPGARNALGFNARARIQRDFVPEDVWEAWAQFLTLDRSQA
ncbi:glycosyltransferase [Nocardioides sp. P5_E3]